MPAKRTSKRSKKTSKAAKAAPPVQEEPVEEILQPTPSVPEVVEESEEKMTGVEETPEISQDTSEKPTIEEIPQPTPSVPEVVEESEEKMTGVEETPEISQDTSVKPTEKEPRLSMEERKAKMEQLRQKMHKSSLANRASLIEESAKQKVTARDAARLEKQRKLAELLRSKADAEERGEDIERDKNWEWTIEENDYWEKKKARKARNADFEFHDDAHAARRRYKKDLNLIKPDLAAYNRQKEVALGLAPGTLSRSGSSSVSDAMDVTGAMQMVPTSEQQRLAAENLYRDANSLLYADNKPTEEAIDRVVGKINQDIDRKGKFSRKRLNEDEGDITYINEHNRVFNKKIARYYDKYTSEIRASFERGTAL